MKHLILAAFFFLIPTFAFASPTWFAYAESGRATVAATCEANPNADSCVSLTWWAERTIRNLTSYVPFQAWLQNEVDELLLPPLLHVEVNLPLVGSTNLAVHLHDLWNDTGCVGLTGTATNGPLMLAQPANRIGCKYGDKDTKAINVADLLDNYALTIETVGFPNLSELLPAETHEGFLKITFLIPSADVDIILRQPESPLESGLYMHAAGKARVEDIRFEVEVWTLGGNLRDPGTIGKSIGLDLSRFYFTGGLALDIDSFDCVAYCDPFELPTSHPFYGDATYRQQTNDANKIVGEVIKYLETYLTYEATRIESEYLTAMEVLNVGELTHDVTGGTIVKPTFAHPFGGNVTVDYDFSYRQDASTDLLAVYGEAKFDVDYGCDIPVPTYPRVVQEPVPPQNQNLHRQGRRSMVGAAIHINLLNDIIDEIWASGIGCAVIGPELGLTVGKLRFAFPTIQHQYDDAPVKVEIRPLFVHPLSDITTFNYAADGPKFLLGDSGKPFGPHDLTLKAPHVEFRFSFEPTPGVWVPLVGFLASVDISAGLGWYILVPNSPQWPDGIDHTSCNASGNPCRVARASFYIESEVQEILFYTTPFDAETLEGVIGNLLAIVLGGELGGYFELGVNLASSIILGVTADPTTNYDPTNPVYVGATVEAFDGDFDGTNDYLGIYLRPSDLNEDGYADTIHPAVLMGEVQGLLAAPKYDMLKEYDTDYYHVRINGGLWQRSSSRIPSLPYGDWEVQSWAVSGSTLHSYERATVSVIPPINQVTEVIELGGCGASIAKGDWLLLFLLFAAYMATLRHERNEKRKGRTKVVDYQARKRNALD